MYAVRLARNADEDTFRKEAKRCLSLDLKPSEVVFVGPDEPALFASLPESVVAPSVDVSRAYHDILRDAICHTSSDRFALLYDVLWRSLHGQRKLCSHPADEAVARLHGYAKAVRRDIHKMHAFVRFRPHEIDGREVFVAWFEPLHFILERATSFFVDRFANMNWMIATPMGTSAWLDGQLAFGPAAAKQRPASDHVLDEVWATYFRSTFNPARVRLNAMRKEMPQRYWSNMPETALIPAMIRDAPDRVAHMGTKLPDAPPRFASTLATRDVQEDAIDTPLEQLRNEAAACRRCPLHAPATQVVFGEGPSNAKLIFVGEQPGDREDLRGKPFVGPAGELLDRAFRDAGIDRSDIYLTNAVKHFKYEARGKRRIHKKPNATEIAVCRWWLERELAALSPKLVVALGNTAANALAQRTISVTRDRGPTTFGSLPGFVTVHPAYLLRVPDKRESAAAYDAFVRDLCRIAELVA